MKLSIVFAAMVASALAAPSAEQPAASELEDRAALACIRPSHCSNHWSGNCEDYCGSHGFSHMTGDGCGLLSKKCCCDN